MYLHTQYHNTYVLYWVVVFDQFRIQVDFGLHLNRIINLAKYWLATFTQKRSTASP